MENAGSPFGLDRARNQNQQGECIIQRKFNMERNS